MPFFVVFLFKDKKIMPIISILFTNDYITFSLLKPQNLRTNTTTKIIGNICISSN